VLPNGNFKCNNNVKRIDKLYILSYTDTVNQRKGFEMKTKLELYGSSSHYDKLIKKSTNKPVKPVVIDEAEQVKLEQIRPYVEEGKNRLNFMA
jgi:hypothetical protein